MRDHFHIHPLLVLARAPTIAAGGGEGGVMSENLVGTVNWKQVIVDSKHSQWAM